MLQGGRSRVSIPDEVIEFSFLNLPIHTSRTMALGLTLSLTVSGMFLRDKARLARKADALTALFVC
jgi:hypothetical protein